MDYNGKEWWQEDQVGQSGNEEMGGKGIIDQRVALDLQRQLDLKFYELNNTGFGD